MNVISDTVQSLRSMRKRQVGQGRWGARMDPKVHTFPLLFLCSPLCVRKRFEALVFKVLCELIVIIFWGEKTAPETFNNTCGLHLAAGTPGHQPWPYRYIGIDDLEIPHGCNQQRKSSCRGSQWQYGARVPERRYSFSCVPPTTCLPMQHSLQSCPCLEVFSPQECTLFEHSNNLTASSSCVCAVWLGHSSFRVGEIVVFKIEGRDIPIVHRVIKLHEKYAHESGCAQYSTVLFHHLTHCTHTHTYTGQCS